MLRRPRREAQKQVLKAQRALYWTTSELRTFSTIRCLRTLSSLPQTNSYVLLNDALSRAESNLDQFKEENGFKSSYQDFADRMANSVE